MKVFSSWDALKGSIKKFLENCEALRMLFFFERKQQSGKFSIEILSEVGKMNCKEMN
jgi:hypothetical protein